MSGAISQFAPLFEPRSFRLDDNSVNARRAKSVTVTVVVNVSRLIQSFD